MKFRKKPVVVEAVEWNGKNLEELIVFCPPIFTEKRILTIPTLEGDMTVSKGDWIIKGVEGEFYPCKPDIFEKTYEAVT